jgi:hypothetical protein
MLDFAARGRFLWMELATRHPETALRFYPAVLGWTTASWPMPGGEPYAMWVANGAPIGGLRPLAPDSRDPAGWLPYVGVSDVDAAVMRAEEEGAVVAAPPADIPGVGRFAVLEDPWGASFAVFRPGREPAPEGAAPAGGEFAWFELATRHLRHALELYAELFAWTPGALFPGEGGAGDYQVLERGGRAFGGLHVPADDVPAAWLAYARVGDLDAAVERVVREGGRIRLPPRPVPGGARVAVAADPDGAAFALIEMP